MRALLQVSTTLIVDGAYSAKNDVGGWAAILTNGERRLDIWGYETPSTNNRMELMAAIMGLRELRRPSTLEVISDSEYVIKGITSWVHAWVKNGWCNSANKPVGNKLLWVELLNAKHPHKIKWTHTRGHLLEKPGRDSLDERTLYLSSLNQQADKLAVEARLLGAGRESSLEESGRTLVDGSSLAPVPR